ncbi:hypothetical protein [Zavarzinella formosa]|uniref:hypothetical protein n=1 Tax=Zavarzinella formosa TaxID=360055 RepID=UPI0002EA94E6|nr:hypothetical protein [Zavarzinella formosa]
MLAAGLLAFGGLAVAAEPEMPGQVRSTYVPRGAPGVAPRGTAPTRQVVQAQGQDTPKDAPKDTVPGGDPPRPPILGVPPRGNQDLFDAYVRLEPPGREKVFGARETEKELEQRFSQLEKDAGRDRIQFPEKPVLTTDDRMHTRTLAPSAIYEEPRYVVYRRLYFEEKNAERYGWDLGPVVQPLVSIAWFYSDTLWFPKHFTSYNCRRFDTNAGLCWPGDPVPYLLYPPEFTVTGSLVEAALVVGLVAVIP